MNFLKRILIASPFIIISILPANVVANSSDIGGLQLVLNIAPDVLPADGQIHQNIYIQLKDSDGNPVLASENISISLSSSDTTVGTVAGKINLAAGENFTVAYFQTTAFTGQTIINAIADGLSAEPISISTTNPFGAVAPMKLVISTAPSKMLPSSKEPGLLAIEILGAKDMPSPVSQDITIRLASSDTEVASVADSIVIHQGNYFAIGEWKPISFGEASITALASGYSHGSTEVQVTEPGEKPVSLELSPLPIVLASSSSHQGWMVIQATDSKGLPTLLSNDVKVNLSSTDPFVADIDQTARVNGEVSAAYQTARITSGEKLGISAITGSAQGLKANTKEISVNGILPKKLILHTAFETALARNEISNLLIIEIQAENGMPVSQRNDTEVTLTSTDPSIPSSATIPAGLTFITVPIRSTQSEKLNISAIAPGLEASSVSTSFARLSIDVSLNTNKRTLLTGQTIEITATVTYAGNPLAGVSIDWQSSNLGLSLQNITNYQGLAKVVITLSTEGSVSVDARATMTDPAFGEGDASIDLTILPITVTETKTPNLQLGGLEIPIVGIAGIISVIIVVLAGFLMKNRLRALFHSMRAARL